MKTLVIDHKTLSKPQWEQDIGFELDVARREAREAAKKRDAEIAKRGEIYFRVYGIDGDREIALGYTGSPKSWSLNSNGWKLEQLRFEPMERGAK